MFLKKCASEDREARKKGSQDNKRPVTDLRERACKEPRGNVPELRNTTFVVVIGRVLNSHNYPTSSMQFKASHPYVRHWEVRIDFSEKNCGPKDPYCLTVLYKCNLTLKELDKEYMGFNAPRQLINDPLSGQISYNSSLSNGFELKLGHNVNLLLVGSKTATGKDNVEHVM
jgi:hypothetical protein